jgi:hypothetical protein
MLATDAYGSVVDSIDRRRGKLRWKFAGGNLEKASARSGRKL